MIVLAGGDVVLPDRIVAGGSVVVDGRHVAAIDPRPSIDPAGARVIDVRGSCVVPGFIDVHLHGLEGLDTLGPGDAVAGIAARLPRYGVTAFCPTAVACGPEMLRGFLSQVAAARQTRPRRSARVLPAHLESNFINPEFRGAQPAACLRLPPAPSARSATAVEGCEFQALEILEVLAAVRPEVGIVTLAPELPGGIELVRDLAAHGHRVALGHSGADFDTAIAAIEAGASHATHLFNRMGPMSHRAPGLAGAVLARADIAAELIGDGHHVHPAMARMAIAAKGAHRLMVISDSTAVAGLPRGAVARLGDQVIHAGAQAAVLADGTWAGSTLTMDRAFRNVIDFGQTLPDAARLCATTAARELGLAGLGAIGEGAIADLVVLDRAAGVRYTLIDGEVVFSAAAPSGTT